MKKLVVREERIAYFVGGFSFILGLPVLLLLYSTGDRPSVWMHLLILIIFGGAGSFIILSGKNRRLEISGNELCYTTLLNRKTEFTADQIGYVKAAASSKQLNIHDKNGKKLCVIDGDMQNAGYLLLWFIDNEITIEVKGKRDWLNGILSQQNISLNQITQCAGKIYKETCELAHEWMERNCKTGAQLEFGFAEYHSEKMDDETQLQPDEALCNITCYEDIPEDYLCTLELYVKKEGNYIRNKKGSLMMLRLPVMYMRACYAADKDRVLVLNGLLGTTLMEHLRWLESYLPRHKFIQEELKLSCPLKKSLEYKGEY